MRAQKIQPTFPGRGEIPNVLHSSGGDEVERPRAEASMDLTPGKPFEGETKIWTEYGEGSNRQCLSREAIYRAVYRRGVHRAEETRDGMGTPGNHGTALTDSRAEVGDTIVIHFRNNATQPYSMHPHGVSLSARDSEGTPYYADMSMAGAGLVPPNQTHTYIWNVPEAKAGPGGGDGSSVVWLYHSHNWEPKDVNAGLIPARWAITRRGMAHVRTGSPKDVDREFATLFMLIDENQSHHLQHNIDAYTQEPCNR